MTCPCCSNLSYQHCCKPCHTGEKYAPSAEALMRSRYSAFAIPDGGYLLETTLPSKRKFHNKKDLQEWGEINEWLKLEIIRKPAKDKVEFKAWYKDEEGTLQLHHELSLFKFVSGRWFYVSGKFLE